MGGSKSKTAPTATDLLYQDLGHTNVRLTELASQVQRIQRFQKLDEKELRVGNERSQAAILSTVDHLARNVDALTRVITAQGDEQMMADLAGQSYRKSMLDVEYRQMQKRIGRLRFLQTCKLVPTGEPCNCGRNSAAHMAVDVKNPSGKIIERRCPASIWVSMSRLAYEDNRLGKFTSEHPLNEFMSKYRL